MTGFAKSLLKGGTGDTADGAGSETAVGVPFLWQFRATSVLSLLLLATGSACTVCIWMSAQSEDALRVMEYAKHDAQRLSTTVATSLDLVASTAQQLALTLAIAAPNAAIPLLQSFAQSFRHSSLSTADTPQELRGTKAMRDVALCPLVTEIERTEWEERFQAETGDATLVFTSHATSFKETKAAPMEHVYAPTIAYCDLGLNASSSHPRLLFDALSDSLVGSSSHALPQVPLVAGTTLNIMMLLNPSILPTADAIRRAIDTRKVTFSAVSMPLAQHGPVVRVVAPVVVPDASTTTAGRFACPSARGDNCQTELMGTTAATRRSRQTTGCTYPNASSVEYPDGLDADAATPAARAKSTVSAVVIASISMNSILQLAATMVQGTGAPLSPSLVGAFDITQCPHKVDVITLESNCVLYLTGGRLNDRGELQVDASGTAPVSHFLNRDASTWKSNSMTSLQYFSAGGRRFLLAASTSPQHVPGPMQCQWWILALSTLATACIALLPMVVGYYRTLLAAQRAEIATLRGDLLCANTAFEGHIKTLAWVGHNLRNPAHVISSAANFLLERFGNDTAAREDLDSITQSSEDIHRILADLMNFRALQEGRLEIKLSAFQLRPVLVRMVVNHRTMARVPLSWNVSSDVPSHMISDPLRLQQIIVNGITNAVKQTVEGAIEVRCFRLRQRQPEQFSNTHHSTAGSASGSTRGGSSGCPLWVRDDAMGRGTDVPALIGRHSILSSSADGDWVVIQVRDTGRGFSKAPESLFEPFVTGLGQVQSPNQPGNSDSAIVATSGSSGSRGTTAVQRDGKGAAASVSAQTGMEAEDLSLPSSAARMRGTGLGLPVAKSMSDALGGSLALYRDHVLNTTVFELVLPLMPPQVSQLLRPHTPSPSHCKPRVKYSNNFTITRTDMVGARVSRTVTSSSSNGAGAAPAPLSAASGRASRSLSTSSAGSTGSTGSNGSRRSSGAGSLDATSSLHTQTGGVATEAVRPSVQTLLSEAPNGVCPPISSIDDVSYWNLCEGTQASCEGTVSPRNAKVLLTVASPFFNLAAVLPFSPSAMHRGEHPEIPALSVIPVPDIPTTADCKLDRAQADLPVLTDALATPTAAVPLTPTQHLGRQGSVPSAANCIPVPVPVIETPPPSRFASIRVLYADDDATNRRIATRMLTRLGVDEVVTVCDGDEVMPAVWRAVVDTDAAESPAAARAPPAPFPCMQGSTQAAHQSSSLSNDASSSAGAAGGTPPTATPCPFDIVFLDVTMARLDGTEACRQLRRQFGPHLHIVAATGNAHAREELLAPGLFSSVLEKPFQLREVQAQLEAVEGHWSRLCSPSESAAQMRESHVVADVTVSAGSTGSSLRGINHMPAGEDGSSQMHLPTRVPVSGLTLVS